MGGFGGGLDVLEFLMPAGTDMTQFEEGMTPKRPKRSWRDRLTIRDSDRLAYSAGKKARGKLGEAAGELPGEVVNIASNIASGVSDLVSEGKEFFGKLSPLGSTAGTNEAIASFDYNQFGMGAAAATAEELPGAETPGLADAIDPKTGANDDELDKIVAITDNPSVLDRLSEGMGGWEGALSGVSDILTRMAQAAANPGRGGVGAAVAGAFAEGVENLDEVWDEAKLDKYIKGELAREDLPESQRKLLEAYRHGGRDLASLQIAQERTAAAGRSGGPTGPQLRADMLNRNMWTLNSADGISRWNLMQMKNPEFHLNAMRKPWIGESDESHLMRLRYIKDQTSLFAGLGENMDADEIAAMKKMSGTPFNQWVKETYGEGSTEAIQNEPSAADAVSAAGGNSYELPEDASTVAQQMRDTMFPAGPEGTVMERVIGAEPGSFEDLSQFGETGVDNAINNFFAPSDGPALAPAQYGVTPAKTGRSTLNRQRELEKRRPPKAAPFSDYIGGG